MLADLNVRRQPLLPSLTGLRFAFALLAFSRHVWWLWQPTALGGVYAYTVMQGTLSVSLFFILSGFVLTWSVRPGDRCGAFFRRRFARVYPSHVLTWVLGGVLTIYVGRELHRDVAAETLFLVQAWVPRLSTALAMNGVSWSLSCDAFLYLLFPLLVTAVALELRVYALGCSPRCLQGHVEYRFCPSTASHP